MVRVQYSEKAGTLNIENDNNVVTVGKQNLFSIEITQLEKLIIHVSFWRDFDISNLT